MKFCPEGVLSRKSSVHGFLVCFRDMMRNVGNQFRTSVICDAQLCRHHLVSDILVGSRSITISCKIADYIYAVSYTHLTLPTNREV